MVSHWKQTQVKKAEEQDQCWRAGGDECKTRDKTKIGSGLASKLLSKDVKYRINVCISNRVCFIKFVKPLYAKSIFVVECAADRICMRLEAVRLGGHWK